MSGRDLFDLEAFVFDPIEVESFPVSSAADVLDLAWTLALPEVFPTLPWAEELDLAMRASRLRFSSARHSLSSPLGSSLNRLTIAFE